MKGFVVGEGEVYIYLDPIQGQISLDPYAVLFVDCGYAILSDWRWAYSRCRLSGDPGRLVLYFGSIGADQGVAIIVLVIWRKVEQGSTRL